jgi:hypothetical protein
VPDGLRLVNGPELLLGTSIESVGDFVVTSSSVVNGIVFVMSALNVNSTGDNSDVGDLNRTLTFVYTLQVGVGVSVALSAETLSADCCWWWC